jgi:hypothetical protein
MRRHSCGVIHTTIPDFAALHRRNGARALYQQAANTKRLLHSALA